MQSNATKLELNLRDKSVISIGRNLASRRFNVNESSNDARLGIGNSYRLVSAHEQKRLKPVDIRRLKLLVNHHLLMRYERVKLCVGFNPAYIAIMCDGHKRLTSERFQRKCI